MLNDVHPPPLEPRDDSPRTTRGTMKAVRRTVGGRRGKPDRAHALERTADHGMGTNLVYDEPEDRGATFNTTMSAIIVATVVIVIAAVSWSLWK